MESYESSVSDTDFVKIVAFKQLLWQNFEESLDLMRQKKQERPQADNDDLIKEIEDEMLNMFDALTPTEGREIIKKVGILITPNIRIVDAIAFNSIMNEMRIKRPNIPGIEQITTRTYYSKDLGALATWDFSAIGHDDVGGSTTKGNVVIKRV